VKSGVINYILFIIGIIFISLSSFFVFKEIKKINNKQTVEEPHEELYDKHMNFDFRFVQILNDLELQKKLINEVNSNYKNIVIELQNKYIELESRIKDLEEKSKKILDAKNEYPSIIKEELSPLEKKIIELHRIGYSKTQIAKELDIGVGEVELIINLKSI